MKIKDVREIIEKDLGLEKKNSSKLNEAYYAHPKTYDINTESLRGKTKKRHEELYENYVKALNAVSADLDVSDRDRANSEYSQFRSTKMSEACNMNAVHLHELYFANISDVYSEIPVDSLSHMRLSRDWGTFDDWQRDFFACGMATKGWVVTCLSTYLQRYINVIIDGHDIGALVGCYPVLVMDCWEHARKDYGNNKQAYLYAMMSEINWNVVEERVKRADAILSVLKA